MRLARAKVEAEGRCRLAHSPPCDGPLEAAHVVERRYDQTYTVPALNVIPLCTLHHARYDARRVGILEVLSYEEQAAAVAKLGITRALRRLTSGQTEAVERAGPVVSIPPT
jgi:hypothetical protein